jgi:hypothetical protein
MAVTIMPGAGNLYKWRFSNRDIHRLRSDGLLPALDD